MSSSNTCIQPGCADPRHLRDSYCKSHRSEVNKKNSNLTKAELHNCLLELDINTKMFELQLNAIEGEINGMCKIIIELISTIKNVDNKVWLLCNILLLDNQNDE
jgi:hypothetical protein